MEPTLKIEKLFDEIDRTAFGSVERALIDEAVALADEAGLDQLAYAARLRLIVSAKMTGDTETVLSTFAWCVGRNAADPITFPTKVDTNDLLWTYKWMAGTLGADPKFDAAMIVDCLDQMESAYVKAGVGLSGVHQSRFWSAVSQGNLVEAERLHALVQATPRDDYSHCPACVLSEDAEFSYLKGDDAAGLELLDQLLADQVTCNEEPERCIAVSLIPLLRADRFADAERLHYRGYRNVRVNPDHLPMVAEHIIFLAVTGNTHRGLELLERHLPWLVHDGLHVSGHRQALIAFAMIGQAIDRDGHGDELVRHAPGLERYLGERDAPWTVRELTVACWAAAEKLAAAFDARNGNTFYTDQIGTYRELAEQRWDLPLGRPTPPAITVTPTEPTTTQEWIDFARSLMVFQEVDGAVDASIDALVTAARLANTPKERGDAHLGLMTGYRLRDEPEAALAHHVQYVQALTDQGRVALAEIETVHRDILTAQDTSDTAVSVLETLSDHDDTDVALTAILALARVRRAQEDVDASDELCLKALRFARAYGDPIAVQEALHGRIVNARLSDDIALEELMNRAQSLLDEDPVAGRRAKLFELLAHVRLSLGDQESAMSDIDSALAAAAPLGFHALTAHLARSAARIADELGRPHESVARWQVALREASLANEDTFLERVSLAEQFILANAPFDAAELLGELIAEGSGNDAQDQAARNAHCLFLLGGAYRRCGEPSEAYAAFTDAIASAITAEQPFIAARSGERLGSLLLDHNDEEALDVLDTAYDAVIEADSVVLLVDILHLRGRARCRFGDESGLGDFDAAVEHASEMAPPWVIADINDSKARGLRELGRLDEAIRCALSSSDGYAAAGDEIGAGAAALLAGEILVEQERFEEAIAVLPDVIDRVRPVQQLFAQACLATGIAYERLGRFDEAAAVRAHIEG